MARAGSFAFSGAFAVFLAAAAGFQTLHGQPSGQTTLNGTLTVLWGDPVPGASSEPLVRAMLTERAGQEHELAFDPGVLEAAGGLRALDRREVTLTARAPLAQPQAAISSPLVVTGVALSDAADAIQADEQPITGPQPWVTILCRFGDSTGLTPKPVSYYQGLMGGAAPGLDHYWREVSYDMINLTGSVVVGWYNLPQPRSSLLHDPGGSNGCKPQSSQPGLHAGRGRRRKLSGVYRCESRLQSGSGLLCVGRRT